MLFYASSSFTTASLPYSVTNNSDIAPNLSLKFKSMSFYIKSSFITILWLLLAANNSSV
jgi:hypothetical protein